MNNRNSNSNSTTDTDSSNSLEKNHGLLGRPGSGSSSIAFIMVALLFLWVGAAYRAGFSVLPAAGLENFTVIFISIVLEAMPFVLLGTVISSAIQLFVTEDMLARIIPQNLFLGLISASLLGGVFPICECANVPVTRRLVRKGVPIHIGITFMMSVAIVNPIVMLSTYYAFAGSVRAVLVRSILGLVGAVFIGFIISLFPSKKLFSRHFEEEEEFQSPACCDHEHPGPVSGCGCCSNSNDHSNNHNQLHQCAGLPHAHDHHEHNHSSTGHVKPGNRASFVIEKIQALISHTGDELFSVGRFLIFGAFISSLTQTLLPREILLLIGQHPILSIVVMMAMAYVLSLCSEADAFIAATFTGQFTTGAIFAFILFGPMIDIKNTLMLLEGFHWKFVIKLIIITIIVCFGFALFINMAGL